MHKTETVTVLPGVRFAYVGTEEYKNASFAVGFKSKTKRGASSCDLILSHLLFRTSADYPDNRRFSQRLEELYATDLSVQSVRFGDFRASVFQATFLDEPFAVEIPDFTRTVLSFVAGAILSPASDENGLFPFEETEREKRALLDRIRGIKNSKTAYAHARLSELTSDPRFYDVPDYGAEEEAEGVTPAAVRERYGTMLYRSEICFVYAGSCPKETVLSLVRELFAKNTRAAYPALRASPYAAPRPAFPRASRAGGDRRGTGNARACLSDADRIRRKGVRVRSHALGGSVRRADVSSVFRGAREGRILLFDPRARKTV